MLRAACLLVVISVLLAPLPAVAAPKHPHIVYVMADDLGYGDVRCYQLESNIPTPHLDRLAAQGVRLTDAHSPSAVCTPTRYGVLTGRYCWRTWLKRGVIGGYTPPLIEPDRVTVASLLKQHGYRTGCFGKWHLGLTWTRANGSAPGWQQAEAFYRGSWQDGDAAKGLNIDFTQPIQHGPVALGFDQAYFTAACSTIDGPFCFIQNDRPTKQPDQMMPIDERKHGDFRPRPGWMAAGFDLTTVDFEFTRQAIAFLERGAREQPDQPQFVYLALSSPHAPWLPPDETAGTTPEGPRGDLIAVVDRCVGELLAALERLKLADDTLVIFTSDNGPRPGGYHHRSAGELRGFKSHIWEGGHRVPFLARWPGRIPPKTTSDEPIELTDLLATCAALVDAKLPDDAGPDSFNVLPALLGQPHAAPLRPAVVSHSEAGVFAVRVGAWKLILETEGSGGWVPPSGRGPQAGSPGQLYHLQRDPGEQHNLYADEPETVARLRSLLERYQRDGRTRPTE